MSTIPIPTLVKALQELDRSANNVIQRSKIHNLGNTIKKFAIASAVSSAAAGALPGLGATIATITQTGIIWSLYLQINKELGISIKKDTMKFIASAMFTNLVHNAGVWILSIIASSLLSFIPGGGVTVCALVGYVVIYTCAILYLQLLTKVLKVKGTIEISNNDETVQIIKDVVKDAEIKDIIKDGKETFKTINLDKEIRTPQCPSCDKSITMDMQYCPHCGACLSKIN